MGYCFKRKESVSDAVRRLGGQRLEHALHCLQKAGRAEAIHAVRKDIKKLRAILRLFESGLRRKEFRRLMRTLKGAARPLAAPRDAYVKAQAIRRLGIHYKGQLTPAALRHVRGHVRQLCREEMHRWTPTAITADVVRTLRRAAREWARLQPHTKGWHALRPGLKSAYRRAQQAYQRARGAGSPARLHVWRKRVKDLGYDVRLLRPIWAEEMKTIADELDTLGELLGEDHDLSGLQSEVDHSDLPQDHRRETDLLAGLIARRQDELRRAAFALGNRFFTEKPGAFCRRVADYWHAWRRMP